MQSKDNIKVACVPPEMLGPMWPHIGPYLLRGQLEIAKGDLKTAMTELTVALLAAQAGHVQFWVVCDDDQKCAIAAMTSQIVEEDGKRVVWVTGMAGEDILRWGGEMSDRMADFAKEEGCRCYRFAGRAALRRAYRDVRIIGQHESGVHLFERAVS